MDDFPRINLHKITAIALLGLTFSSSFATPAQAKSSQDIYVSQVNETYNSRNTTSITGGVVAGDDDTLYSVWSQYGPDGIIPFFAKSTDGGQSWGDRVAVSAVTDPAHNDIAICHNLLVTTYFVPHTLIASFSSDDGASWGDDAVVNTVPTPNVPMAVRLDTYQNELGECLFYFSWLETEVGFGLAPEDSPKALNFRMYNADRQSWGSIHRIGYLAQSTLNVHDINLQSTVDSTGEVHIIYRDGSDTNQQLYYVRSNEVQNNNWTTPVQMLAGYGPDAKYASISSGTLAYSGGVEKLFIVASLYSNGDIGMISKGITATNWSSPVTVNQPNGVADVQPVLTITDEGVLYVAWQRDIEANPADLVRRASLDGVNWGTEIYLDTFINRDEVVPDHMQMTPINSGYSLVYHREKNFFSATEPSDY